MRPTLLAAVPYAVASERAQDHRLDDLHDLVGVGIVRANLRALVGVEKALEQGAEDGGIDFTPIEALGRDEEADVAIVERQRTPTVGEVRH